jgi:hypothetical protein
VRDVDICVCGKEVLNRLEKLFNSKLLMIDEKKTLIKDEKTLTSQGDIDSIQYYLWVDEKTHLDIFYIKTIKQFKLIKSNIYKYNDCDFACVDTFDRFNQLMRTFNQRHTGSSPLNKVVFKYLCKIMNYKIIIEKIDG